MLAHLFVCLQTKIQKPKVSNDGGLDDAFVLFTSSAFLIYLLQLHILAESEQLDDCR